jgi:hypothetical protein
MRHFFLLLGLLLGPASGLLAQSRSSLSGRTTDVSGKPVPYVNLALKKASDSSVVKLAVSLENGRFSFVSVLPGKYFVEASFLGYRRLRRAIPAFEEGETPELGDLILEPSDVQLKEVEILATKSFLVVEPDKLVVRVENNPLMINNNALEVLRKSPGVMVNQDDQIFLQGKSGLQVYIDGRPSPLQDKDLANYLRGIPSSQIELVEIITNPSAKFDASGNAGIINIRLKKNQKRGLNGGVVSGVSQGLANEHNYFRTNQGFSLNHGGKKLNLFSTYGFDQAKSWSFMNFDRTQSENVFRQTSDTWDKRLSHNLKLGADWTVNKRHVLSFAADGNLNNNTSTLIGENYISTLGNPRPYTLLDARNNGTKETATGNLSLNHLYRDTSGRELSTDVSYGFYLLGNETDQPNFYRNFAPDSSVEDRSFGLETPVDISIFTLKSDYEQKWKKSVFSAGYKVSNVLTDNSFRQFDRSFGQNNLDLDQSSDFSYLERVLAGYLSFRHTLNTRWTFQAGVRYEHTQSEGHLKYASNRKDSLVPRNYGDFFPSGGVTWNRTKNQSISLNYSRRIDRPVYRFLNPFQYKIDELSYEQGNPFLNPQYTHNIQLNSTWFSMINASIGFSQTDDFFARLIDSSGKRSFLTRRNLARVRNYSFNLSTQLPFRKWWNGFVNLTLNHQEYEADFGQGKVLRLPVDYFSVFLQQSFRLPKSYGFQFSGSYNSPSVWGGTFRNRAFWFMEAGFNKKLFKDKATLSLNVTDVFLSQRWKGRSNFAGVDITVAGGNDSRNVKLGFTWNFGAEEVRQIRRKVGNNEERQRLRGE